MGVRLAAALGAVSLVFSSAFSPTPASAQAPAPPAPTAALSVSPPTSSLNATPGTASTQKIGLDNISDETRNVTVLVQNFSAVGEQGQAQLNTGEGPYALAQWITVSPASATLEPNGHQDFEVSINVPQNAPPGGHFGAIVFSPNAGEASGGAALSVVSQVTSLILLRVPGDAIEKASVAGVNLCRLKGEATTCDKSSGFFQKGPVTLTARLRNEGNVQIQPQGTVTIYNMFGSKLRRSKSTNATCCLSPFVALIQPGPHKRASVITKPSST